MALLRLITRVQLIAQSRGVPRFADRLWSLRHYSDKSADDSPRLMRASSWPMMKWYLDHESHPWPTVAEQNELAASTGRTRTQVRKYMSSLRHKNFKYRIHDARARYVIMEWFRQNVHDPYPDATQLESLASETGLSHKSISSRLGALRVDVRPPDVDPYSSEKPQPMVTESVRFALTSESKLNRKGKRRWPSTSDTSILDDDPNETRAAVEQMRGRFQCTVCSASFSRSSIWRIHELEVHGYNETEWICMPDGLQEIGSTCGFCSEKISSADHHEKHRASACLARARHLRTYSRRRQLIRHIHEFHNSNGKGPSRRRAMLPVNVPPEWERPVKNINPHALWCGFCKTELESVKARMKHVAQHFRDGKTKEDWVHRPSSSEERDKP